jgi:hypothetical protein
MAKDGYSVGSSYRFGAYLTGLELDHTIMREIESVRVH